MSHEPRVTEVGAPESKPRPAILGLGLIGLAVTLLVWRPIFGLAVTPQFWRTFFFCLPWLLMGWGAGVLAQRLVSVKTISAVSWGMWPVGFVVLFVSCAPLYFGYTEFNYKERIQLSGFLQEIAYAVFFFGIGLRPVVRRFKRKLSDGTSANLLGRAI